MKTMMTWLLGLAMALLSGLALADAKVFSMTGTVSAATGAAPAQPVKVGDTIRVGQTAVTAANSTVVLQFPDGQLTALSPNTRMTIEQYQFNEQAKSGNILLNLVRGGMRAVTGLIGRTSPDKVAFKAGTATIGVRGTDLTIAFDGLGGPVLMTVSNGFATFTTPLGTVTIPAGSAIVVNPATGAVTLNVVSIMTAMAQVVSMENAGAIAAAVTTLSLPNTTATLTSAATGNTATVSTVTTTGTEITVTPPQPPPPPASP